jgi:hypothetical protein
VETTLLAYAGHVSALLALPAGAPPAPGSPEATQLEEDDKARPVPRLPPGERARMAAGRREAVLEMARCHEALAAIGLAPSSLRPLEGLLARAARAYVSGSLGLGLRRGTYGTCRDAAGCRHRGGSVVPG